MLKPEVNIFIRAGYFFILFVLIWVEVCFAYNDVEVDFMQNKLKIADFCSSNLAVEGDFSFVFKNEDDSLIFDVEGKNVSFRGAKFAWVKSRMVKKGEVIFIDFLSSPDFYVKGKVDLKTNQISLDVDISSLKETIPSLGVVKAKTKIWGKLGDLFMSGSVVIENGKYQNKEFSYLSLNFLGKPPLLNLTDAKCVLRDGNIYQIEGVIDLADFNNLFPAAVFVSRKVSLNGWELLFDGNKSMGLKKDVDSKFDMVFDTYDINDRFMNDGAELRYKMEQGQFLRFRMQDDKTIVGFERKKEF